MPTIPSVIFFQESFPEIYRKLPRGPTTCSVLQRNKPRTQFAKRTRWGPPWALPQRSGMKWASRSDAAFSPSQGSREPSYRWLSERWYKDGTEITVDFLGIFPKWKDVLGESKVYLPAVNVPKLEYLRIKKLTSPSDE